MPQSLITVTSSSPSWKGGHGQYSLAYAGQRCNWAPPAPPAQASVPSSIKRAIHHSPECPKRYKKDKVLNCAIPEEKNKRKRQPQNENCLLKVATVKHLKKGKITCFAPHTTANEKGHLISSGKSNVFIISPSTTKLICIQSLANPYFF